MTLRTPRPRLGHRPREWLSRRRELAVVALTTMNRLGRNTSRVKPSAIDHPKMLRLSGLLGEHHLMTIGRMECFWSWVARYRDTGDLSDLSSAEIARAARWTKDPGKLVEAMVTVRWLDRDAAGSLSVHDWTEHRPAYLRDRDRQRRHRDASRDGNAAVTEKSPPSPPLCSPPLPSAPLLAPDGAPERAGARHRKADPIDLDEGRSRG